MRTRPLGFCRYGVRRQLVALTVAYLLALQGLLGALGMATAVAASVSPDPAAIICSTAHETGESHHDGSELPCCGCGPLCSANSGITAGAAPEAASIPLRRSAVATAGWSVRLVDVQPRAFLTPQQARAPPSIA